MTSTQNTSVDTFELRRRAANGDAEACNRLGMLLLNEAPGELLKIPAR